MRRRAAQTAQCHCWVMVDGPCEGFLLDPLNPSTCASLFFPISVGLIVLCLFSPGLAEFVDLAKFFEANPALYQPHLELPSSGATPHDVSSQHCQALPRIEITEITEISHPRHGYPRIGTAAPWLAPKFNRRGPINTCTMYQPISSATKRRPQNLQVPRLLDSHSRHPVYYYTISDFPACTE